MMALPIDPVHDHFRPFERVSFREDGWAIAWSSPGPAVLLCVAGGGANGFVLPVDAPSCLGFQFARSHFGGMYATAEGTAAYGGVALLAGANLLLYCTSLTKALVKTWRVF